MFKTSFTGSRAGLAVVCTLLALAGCNKEPAPAKKEAAVAVTRPHSNVPLAARLLHEAENRPARAIRAEEVFAALRAQGVTITSARQVLGETLGASYCESGLTTHGVALAVCEFSDPEAAVRGEARSHALFDKLIKNRVLAVNGQTLFTVVPPSAGAAETQQLVERFASL